MLYYGRYLKLKISNKESTVTEGHVFFTKIAKNLIKAIHPNSCEMDIQTTEYENNYYHYIVEKLYKQNIILSEPLENKKFFSSYI